MLAQRTIKYVSLCFSPRLVLHPKYQPLGDWMTVRSFAVGLDTAHSGLQYLLVLHQSTPFLKLAVPFIA